MKRIGRPPTKQFKPGMRLAIKAVGGQSALARLLKVAPNTLHYWDEVPLDRLLQVEKATGVPREKLRPDLYR